MTSAYCASCGTSIGSLDDEALCRNCDAPADLDPWAVAGGDLNLDRLAETRHYRQTKYRP